MKAEFEKALELYRDGVILKAGRMELSRRFLEHFPQSSKSLFNKLVNDGVRPPTPEEEDWLVENITHYHARYLEYARPQTQLSIMESVK